MNNFRYYGIPKPRKAFMGNQGEKKNKCLFESEAHFTVEEFCKETGYTKDFVMEAIQYSDEFMCFNCDGITVIPKNAKHDNVRILRRAKYQELS